MSMSHRKTKVIDIREVEINCCCECGMQFCLFGIVVMEVGELSLTPQVNLDFCPYCGKRQNQL